MQDLSKKLLSRFIFLRELSGKEIDVGDAAMVINDLISIIEEYNIVNQKNILDEINAIHDKIQEVKQELTEKLSNGVVPEATLELDAVVKSTEEATNKILDSTEKIRDIVNTLEKTSSVKEIENEIINIFEACNFQDITGQRIKKVTSTLQFIEESIDNLLLFSTKKNTNNIKQEKSASKTDDSNLMNGPQLDIHAPSQDEVDKLFNNC